MELNIRPAHINDSFTLVARDEENLLILSGMLTREQLKELSERIDQMLA